MPMRTRNKGQSPGGFRSLDERPKQRRAKKESTRAKAAKGAATQSKNSIALQEEVTVSNTASQPPPPSEASSAPNVITSPSTSPQPEPQQTISPVRNTRSTRASSKASSVEPAVPAPKQRARKRTRNQPEPRTNHLTPVRHNWVSEAPKEATVVPSHMSHEENVLARLHAAVVDDDEDFLHPRKKNGDATLKAWGERHQIPLGVVQKSVQDMAQIGSALGKLRRDERGASTDLDDVNFDFEELDFSLLGNVSPAEIQELKEVIMHSIFQLSHRN